MLQRFLRYAVMSTALFYNACQPPEDFEEIGRNPPADEDILSEDICEDKEPLSKSRCANGEVLFEDEFEGSELDFNQWWGPKVCGAGANYRLREGILEINDGYGNCLFQSSSTYTLDDRTLCFEARWKVREMEGIVFGVSLVGAGWEVGCSVDLEGRAFCGNYLNKGKQIYVSKEINPTNWHSYRFEASRDNVHYYVDDVPVGTTCANISTNAEVNVNVSCISGDRREKRCYIDNIMLTR